jgi:hypothetical protein
VCVVKQEVQELLGVLLLLVLHITPCVENTRSWNLN